MLMNYKRNYQKKKKLWFVSSPEHDAQEIIDIIDNTPTVEFHYKPKRMKIDKDGNVEFEYAQQGEWNEWTDERWGGTTIYCPYCKENALTKYRNGLYRQVKSNFCPNCGADMRGEYI